MTEGNGNLVMPVGPMGGYGNGGGFGFGDNGAWWLLILLIAMGGWGNGFGFGGNGGGFVGADVQRGFDQSALVSGINGVQNTLVSGFGDVQTALCGGFAGVNQNISQTGNGVVSAITGAQNALTQQMYGNEIASLERSYAAQTASTAGINGVQAQIAQTGYNTTSGIADLKYTVATENSADRYEAAQNTRDIIDSQTRGTQAILDKLCALELDGVKSQLAQAQRENIGLQNAVNMATFRESQANQNALFAQGLTNEVDALYNRLKNCPVNTVPVAGNTPLFSCNPSFNGNNGGCGCGYGFANG